jgi:hypothetical protein
VEKLLDLAASVGADGGDGVVRTLGGILEREAAFDLGEVAVVAPLGFKRWTLTDDEREIAAADLLFRVQAERQPLRIDDLPEAEPFPRTRDKLRALGLRSLLTLPLGARGGADGAIVLGRRHGWAFVGASLPALLPAASMAGICLARAEAVTTLTRKLAALGEGVDRRGADRSA